MQQKRVLYVSQEIQPFLTETEISGTVRKVSQGIKEQEKKYESLCPLWLYQRKKTPIT